MSEENKTLFAEFKSVHDLYKSDKFKYQDKFNELGLQVRKIMEEWDTRLCGRMESGKNATYSARLSQKFWDEIRSVYPLIDFVGVKITKARLS